jgi:hypothetical protein
MLIEPAWPQSIYNVVFSPDGQRLYVNASGAAIEVLDSSAGYYPRLRGETRSTRDDQP